MAIRTLSIVHHSHTDYGFTHDVPTVRFLHRRFREEASKWIEKYRGNAPGEQLIWSIETGAIADFPVSDDPLIEHLALRNHQTPIAGLAEYLLSKAYGKHALSCDVNGHNWDLVDVLLDQGVETFTSAINTHFGRAPRRRPELFLWQGPSGRCLPAFNGFHYGTANRLGVGNPDLGVMRDQWLPRLQDHLAEVGYEHPDLMVTAVHRFGDNGSIYPEIAPWVQRWNEAHGDLLRVRLCTMATWWETALPWAQQGETLRGDWSDFWVFGALSRARELAIHRDSRSRHSAASLLAVALGRSEEGIAEGIEPYLDTTEHTYNADWARDGQLTDSWVQGMHKSKLVADAFTTFTRERREGLAALALATGATDGFLVLNPTAYPLTVSGLIPAGVEFSRGSAPAEPTAQRHYQDRNAEVDLIFRADRPDETWGQIPRHWLRPLTLPPFGYQVVSREEALVDPFDDKEVTSDFTFIENDHHRLDFDLVRGIVGWTDHRLGRQWVTPGEVLFERVVEVGIDETTTQDDLFFMDWGAESMELPSGWARPWPYRTLPSGPCRDWRKVTNQLGVWVEFFQDAADGVVARTLVFLPSYADWVELTCSWVEGVNPKPRNVQMAFPFSVDLESLIRCHDGGGCLVRPGIDQIEGTCHDFYTTQSFFALGDGEGVVTVANPINPLVSYGGLNFGQGLRELAPSGQAYGLVTNNAWQCNFDPVQPGFVQCRYRLGTSQSLVESEARALASGAGYPLPVIQRCDEVGVERGELGLAGRLVTVVPEDGPVQPVLFHEGQVVLHNFSDGEAGAEVRLMGRAEPVTVSLGARRRVTI